MPHPNRGLRSPLVLTLALAGCVAAPEVPLTGPEIEARVTYYAGDPVGGPLDQETALALELAAEAALPVTSRLYLLAELPGERYEPLTRAVRLIVAGGGTEPLVPSSLLTTATRLATGEAGTALARDVDRRPPHEAALAASFEGLSLPGVTTSMAATHVRPIELIGYRPSERRVSVELWRADEAPDEVSIALVLSDVVEVLVDDGPRVARVPRHEKLVLEPRLQSDGPPVVVFSPARFDPEERLAYVLVIEAGRPPAGDPELAEVAELLQVVRGEVELAAIEGADRRRPLRLEDQLRLQRLRAVDALDNAAYARTAIVELAAGAPIATGIALVAGDEFVGGLSARLAAEAELLRGLAGSAEALAWRVEREALDLLLQALARDDLAPEYEALLLRHTGEAGRLPGALGDAAAASSSVAAFYARITEENRFALEESSPAARLRAHDWLSANGIGVPGFDPLGEREERRAALRAWAETRNPPGQAPVLLDGADGANGPEPDGR